MSSFSEYSDASLFEIRYEILARVGGWFGKILFDFWNDSTALSNEFVLEYRTPRQYHAVAFYGSISRASMYA